MPDGLPYERDFITPPEESALPEEPMKDPIVTLEVIAVFAGLGDAAGG